MMLFLHLTAELGICTGSSLVCHVCWALQYLAPWAGKDRRNQNTDQLGDYNVEQIKNQLEILYCLWHLAVEIDTSVEKNLGQTVQRQCNERVFWAAIFLAFRYDDEQSRIIGAAAASPDAP